MRGRITKGIAGFYYVYAQDQVLYECKARGIFRKEEEKPVVGDIVEVTPLKEQDERFPKGAIDAILPRRNKLLRPYVANVDQALIIFALKSPDPNFNLLDRFLIMADYYEVPALICFNKEDLSSEGEKEKIKELYAGSGAQILFTDAKDGKGLDELRELLSGKTTTVAGPSGVGKSTITNLLFGEAYMETGGLSEKIERGKNTTRHAQLLALPYAKETYLIDTPGFTSLDVPDISPEKLRFYYPEFSDQEGQCRFDGCVHISEPGCQVKEKVLLGVIPGGRYENYKLLYEELKMRKRY